MMSVSGGFVGAWAVSRMLDAEAKASHEARTQAAIKILTKPTLSLRDPLPYDRNPVTRKD
jgi:hypothetical protein